MLLTSSANPIHLADLGDHHMGLTEPVAGALHEAASVCLDRHHDPPVTIQVDADGESSAMTVAWTPPDERVLRCHANEIDATEDGACAVSMACVERTLALVVIGRTHHATGADWYVGPKGTEVDETGLPNLDDPSVLGLEVSGVDRGSIGGRLKDKKKQILKADYFPAGIAAVVGFERAIVGIARVSAEG